MKKLLVLSLICFCFSPAFAQRGKTVHVGVNALGGGAKLPQTVSAQVVRQTAQSQRAASAVRLAQITNMPGQPTVKLGGSVADVSAVLPARMLPGGDSDLLIHPTNSTGWYTGECFMPQDILAGNEKSFYRGMRLENIEDLKNLLINGLEANKTYYNGQIYASLKLSVVLFYLTRGNEEQLPVLIKIPATETLRSYAPEAFPTEDRYAPRAFQTGEQAIFSRDIPTRFISDVWIFLEVNGKPDWYKAILEKDELVFIPALGKMVNY